MFGIFDDIINVATKTTKTVVNTTVDVATLGNGDTINKVANKGIDLVTQPARDTVEVLNGLSEGELRERAIARLGADAIVGLGSSEIIDLLTAKYDYNRESNYGSKSYKCR